MIKKMQLHLITRSIIIFRVEVKVLFDGQTDERQMERVYLNSFNVSTFHLSKDAKIVST